MRIQRVLVGLDGSDDAIRAAAFAAALCVQLDAEVVGVHAMGLLEAFGDDDGGGKHLPASREHVQGLLHGPWRQPFLDADVTHRVELRDGNPVHVLLSAADDLDVDLIVIGSRGTGGLAEQLIGSTSRQITERSAIPVLVVPGPHEGRTRDAWSSIH